MTPDWQARAKCRDAPAALFFPSARSHSENRRLEAQAFAICGGCPVRDECRESAQTSNVGQREQYGIWGGQNFGPKVGDFRPGRRPRTLECDICGTRWRWLPTHGYKKPPKTCSGKCLRELRSRIARARDRHGWERVTG